MEVDFLSIRNMLFKFKLQELLAEIDTLAESTEHPVATKRTLLESLEKWVKTLWSPMTFTPISEEKAKWLSDFLKDKIAEISGEEE
jgi:hypothetical protein